MLKHVLYASLILLWILDTVFTLMFVGEHGLMAEANPLIRYVLAHTGPAGFVCVKLMSISLLAPLHNLPKRETFYVTLLALVNVILIPVVLTGGIVAFGLHS